MLAGVALSALPLAASADDSIAEIAARNAKAAEAERAAKEANPAKSAEEQSAEGKGLVGSVLLGSVVLSFPFYRKNVQRLFIKISSGGEDDGYDSVK